MLPPLQTIATVRPANRCGTASTAASAAAPDGSTKFRVFSIIVRVAARRSSSETRTKSSSSCHKIRCVSSNAVLVASPSAKVRVASVTRARSFQDRYAAGAADRYHDHRDVGPRFEHLQRVSAHARDQHWLVGGVNVPVPMFG